MFELVRAGERTWYVENPTKIGIYQVSDTEVWFIDSGNDKDCARKLCNKILAAQGWTLKGIAVTHSNADHIGGCAELKKRTGCLVAAQGIEKAMTENTLLEPALLYAGYPMKALRNKFLMAASCPIDGGYELLPPGLEPIELRGHFFDMYGFRTSDGVVFLADSVFSAETTNKYHFNVVTDVAEFFSTLDRIETMEASLFVPSHAPATEDPRQLVAANRAKALEIISLIEDFCPQGITMEELMKALFDHYGLTLDLQQYVLAGTTIRSYLSYLCDQSRMETLVENNRLLFRTVK